MRYFIIALSLFALTACGGEKVKLPTAIENFSAYDMYLQDVFWRSLYPSRQEQALIMFSSESFKPSSRDIAIRSADLNEDGKMDFIAAIIHYSYSDNNTYPVFIMIQDEFGGYFRYRLDQRTTNFDVKVLPEKSNGMQNISIDGRTLIFDGKKYVTGL